MGCCVSTGNNNDEDSKSSTKAAPPTKPPVEDEISVVKEVLSETPTLPQKASRFVNSANHDQPSKKPIIPDSPKKQQLQKQARRGGALEKPRMVLGPSAELWEEAASEIYRSHLGESFSAADDKMNHKGYGYGHGHGHGHDDVGKIRPASPGRYRNRQVAGERTEGKSPARRSPGRVGSGVGSNGSSVQRLAGGNNGERFDRRCGSPVVNRSGLSRSPSMRGLGRSPGRVRSDLGGRAMKMDHGVGGGGGGGGGGVGSSSGRGNMLLPPTNSSESLENPLVSLECFIFL